RIATIFAGPLANYLFASVLFFGALMIGGELVASNSTIVEVVKGGAADAAHMKTGDKIMTIDGAPIATFDEMRKVVLKHPGDHLNIVVERQGKSLPLTVTPLPKAEN